MYPKPLLLALFTLLLSSVAVAQTTSRSSVSQFGITWTFDQQYPTGQFANGDYWVLGPVKIVTISPKSVNASGRTKHGSMLNPTPKNGIRHGYDSAMAETVYQTALNAALGVSSSKPLTIKPTSSLVSTISFDSGGKRPQVKTAAILTVLDKVPPAGSFRPSYCGDQRIKFNKSQLDYSKLRRLKPVLNAPSLGSMERAFERPWLDHVPTWNGREAHPQDNMPDYGRDMSVKVSEGALMLNLDISNSLKEKLLVRYVQLGIDLFGIVQAGGNNNWAPNGGHGSGRKFPILFAGVLLSDPAMSNIGQNTSTLFGEDAQTFYVRETSPGVFNNGHGGYGKEHKDMPAWGLRHATDPKRDDARWTGSATPYRFCCTANSWLGFVLAARIMGLQSKWNHDALFDYQDLYIERTRQSTQPGWASYSPFPLTMWDVYRKPSASVPTGLVAKVILEDAFDTPTGQPRQNTVKLQWHRFGQTGEPTYNVYRQEGSQPLVLLTKGLTGLTYNDKTVKKGKTYFYVLTAVLDKIESQPSAKVRVAL